MANSQTVTGLLLDVRNGNDEAIERLFDLYLTRLEMIGRQTYRSKFADVHRPVEDEEDAAISALETFCAALRSGKVNQVANRHQLWKLLVTITIRKIYDQRERATAQKRGGKGEIRKSSEDLEELLSKLPAPDAAAELSDNYNEAMRVLADDRQRRIVSLDMQGKTREEIAEELGVTERTVYRELSDSREKWEAHFRLEE